MQVRGSLGCPWIWRGSGWCPSWLFLLLLLMLLLSTSPCKQHLKRTPQGSTRITHTLFKIFDLSRAMSEMQQVLYIRMGLIKVKNQASRHWACLVVFCCNKCLSIRGCLYFLNCPYFLNQIQEAKQQWFEVCSLQNYPMNFNHRAGYPDWGAVNRWETTDSGFISATHWSSGSSVFLK